MHRNYCFIQNKYLVALNAIPPAVYDRIKWKNTGISKRALGLVSGRSRENRSSNPDTYRKFESKKRRKQYRCHWIISSGIYTVLILCNIISLWRPPFSSCTENQIEAQRSGFDLERRSDGMNERWLFKIKSRRERYEVRDDVVDLKGIEPSNLTDANRALSQLSYKPIFNWLKNTLFLRSCQDGDENRAAEGWVTGRKSAGI